ncbi:hypothetical protein INT44_005596 [Umbelopsis vinacea]|uniref:FAD-binding domain-containing protein n=1 Tax=Umbelopsis vinacea TaxID=44442 RepID=A0A8H7UI65_9FUNG|nr:hypothetical protein INT44_005596 [Umbelopsis vinacea]
MAVKKVIIIGGGPSGLVLAHGLQKNGIPYEVYERDESPTSRDQGLALSLHFAIPYMEKCMSPEHYKNITRACVNPSDADNPTFVVVDGASGKILIKHNNAAPYPTASSTETNKSYRVSRRKLRNFLEDGVEIQWNKRFKEYELTDDGVLVRFEDGSETKGDILVGADGARSRVCDQLCGDKIQKNVLPFVFVAVTIPVNRERYQQIYNISSTHGVVTGPTFGPEGNRAIFFSMLDIDEANDKYEILIVMTWKNSSGEHGLPEDQASRVKLLKEIGALYCDPFKSIILDLKGDEVIWTTTILEKIPSPWNNNGKVTLIGDSAHSMSMARGEEAVNSGKITAIQALGDYEETMIKRSVTAVKASHDAIYDRHTPKSSAQNQSSV